MEGPSGGTEATAEDAAVARLITRLSADYVLSAFQALINTFGDIRSGLLWAAISTANVAHIDTRSEEARRAAAADGFVQDGARRPVSVANLAAATGVPIGTTQRIVRRLIDAGDCVEGADGLIVPQALLERPQVKRMATANMAYVAAFIRKLLARGLIDQAPPTSLAGHPAVAKDAMASVVMRHSLEFGLRALPLLVHAYGEIQLGIVAHAIVTTNTQHLDAPMGEGWRYAGVDQPPPDSARRPVSVSELARTLGLPYETLRRRVHRLIEGGVCVRVAGGVVVPTAVLERPDAGVAAVANVRYVRKFADILRGIGFDPYEGVVADGQTLESSQSPDEGIAVSITGSLRQRIEDYRERAKRAEVAALESEAQREAMLGLAARWLDLAREAEMLAKASDQLDGAGNALGRPV